MGFKPAPFAKAYDISLNKFRKYYATVTIMLRMAILVVLISTVVWCQTDSGLRVSFWNVENLFDMENDPEKNDDEKLCRSTNGPECRYSRYLRGRKPVYDAGIKSRIYRPGLCHCPF